MFTDAEKGARWASAEDSRICVGRYLRKSGRLIRTPQLMNVLRGEMSSARNLCHVRVRSGAQIGYPLLRPSAYRQTWDYGGAQNAISLRGFARGFACETAVRSVLCEYLSIQLDVRILLETIRNLRWQSMSVAGRKARIAFRSTSKSISRFRPSGLLSQKTAMGQV